MEGYSNTEPYTISVGEKTVVDGRDCRRLSIVYDETGDNMFREDLVAYEEGGKVYVHNFPEADPTEDGWHLMLDFTVHKGDVATDYGSKVVEEDSVEVGGQIYRRLSCGNFYWVEGVGPNTDCWACNTYIITMMQTHEMLECYDNGKLIFSKADFTKEAYKNSDNGVESIEVKQDAKGKTYDLSGRRINTPRKGEVYIQDGVKRVER